jgi:hypothetical protein
MQHVYGYRNTKTNTLWIGQVQMLDILSDSSHPDNRGRLETFVNDTEHGKLDWERITDKGKWDELVSIYGAQQGIIPDAKEVLVKEVHSPTKVEQKTKSIAAKKTKKPVQRMKKPIDTAQSSGEVPL